MRTIDFSREVAGGRRPAVPQPTANLDYHERARARLRLGPAAWEPGTRLADALDPNGDDAALFHTTRAAALRVLHFTAPTWPPRPSGSGTRWSS